MIANDISSSNLEKVIETCLKIASKFSTAWDDSNFDNKRKLQNLIFPEGILYNKPNNTVRTPRINSIFSPIPILTGISKEYKKRHLSKSAFNAHLVASSGIEPESGASETLILSIVLRGPVTAQM
jgi:site-specific DNA recombinase